MTRQIEIPEQKKIYVKKASTYDDDFLAQKVDLLEGKIAQTLPIFGPKLVEQLFEKTQVREYLKALLTEYYNGMHAHTFNSLKAVVKAKLTREDFPITYETMESLVKGIENDYAEPLKELGIEPEAVLAPYIRNQTQWFNTNFKFPEEK